MKIAKHKPDVCICLWSPPKKHQHRSGDDDTQPHSAIHHTHTRIALLEKDACYRVWNSVAGSQDDDDDDDCENSELIAF